MKATSILIKGGHIIALDEAGHRLTADILIEGSRIARIAPNIDQPSDKVLKADGMLVLPGMVQAHLHLCQTLLRGQADDMGLLDWLNTITSLEALHTPETLYASARLGLAEMIKSGATSLIDMGTLHHQDSVFRAIEESGMRAQAGKAMMDLTDNLPPALRETTEDSLKESIDLLHRWDGKADGRIRYGFAPRWQLWNTEELLTTIKQEADAHPGVGIHGHAAEIQDEVTLMLEQRGLRNLKYLEKIGVVGPNVQMAHCIWLDDEEVQVMADTGTSALHCPCCNTKLGSGIARIPEMLERGVNVALGSDGAPSNNNLDMFIEMRVASIIHKYRLGPEHFPAEDVLRIATNGGAKAMMLGSEIGSVEVGKKADLIVLSDGGLHGAPLADYEVDDPVRRIVSAFQSNAVQHSIIDGRLVMENRTLLTMNEDEIHEDARQAWRDVRTRSLVQ